MRVTSIMPELQYQMQQAQETLATATQQLATGLRVSMPSDDPSAAAAMFVSLAHAANIDQYTASGNALLSQLQTADSNISTVVSALTSAVSLGTQGANGINSASDRAQIATEVQGLLKTVIAMANTKFQGAYIFGGSAQAAPPFAAASSSFSSTNGTAGAPLTPATPLTAGSTTTISDAGTGQTFTFTASAGDTINTLQTAIQNAVTAGTLSAGTTSTISANGQFQVSNAAGMSVSSSDATLGAMQADPGTAIADAYAYVGNSTVNQVQVGDAMSVDANQSGSALFGGANGPVNALTALVKALQSGNSSAISNATNSVSASIIQLDSARVPIGVSMNRISNQETYLSQEKVTLTQQQNSLVGIDAATAATNLSQAQVNDNAVLAAAAKALPQTLLDFLK